MILQEIIKELDVPSTAQTQIRTFQLNYASAEEVAQTLQEVLTGERGGDNRRMDAWDRAKLRNWQREQGLDQEGIVGTVNVAHNARLNVVVVSSDPAELLYR